MKKRGVRITDPLLETSQVDWLIVPIAECPDPSAESRLVRTFFRRVHEPWGPGLAFVLPVKVQRSRRRVLFRQESGLLAWQ